MFTYFYLSQGLGHHLAVLVPVVALGLLEEAVASVRVQPLSRVCGLRTLSST